MTGSFLSTILSSKSTATLLLLYAALSCELLSQKCNQSSFAIHETGTPVVGYVRQEVIYGHIHMAKTAGTEIMGKLALNFERVCSHNGYSYDFSRVNEKKNSTKSTAPDLVSKQHKGYHRGRIPNNVMIEIGFDDCDFISHEWKWDFWDRFKEWNMEYHVPCREPISHLMSQCNYKHLAFDCNNTNVEEEVAKCMLEMKRFSWKIGKNQPKSIGGLKCYNPIPIDPYINFMSKKLQRKRFESEYVRRSSNKPRHKDKECLWKDPELIEKVRRVLLKNYDYYQFCDECMGSENDLLEPASAKAITKSA